MRRFITYILCFAALLTGCALNRATVQPVCRHIAIYNALSYSDLTGSPVRIAIGHSAISDNLHAQAQALVDGEWRWLEKAPAGVDVGERDEFWPKEYVKVQDLVDLLGITNPDSSDLGVIGS